MTTIYHHGNRHLEEIPSSPSRHPFKNKILLTGILLATVLAVSFGQQGTTLLPSRDSCYQRPPEQLALALKSAGTNAILRVAYVIPSNRAPQPNGVANLQHAVKLGQQFFKQQMEQNGFGPKTFTFETEDDGITPMIHVVHVPETDEYLRGALWSNVLQAASNAGISLWAQGEVWVVIPETYLMFPDGSGTGGWAMGGGFGSGTAGGVAMIGSNALPLFHPAMITDDTPYDGKVLPELGPYPMKQDVTFAWFEGSTFSSVASSWLGALWHETGHAFGLGHDFRNDNNFHGNLMGNGLRGIRGSLFPEKYPQDYTRLEYWTALFFNVSHFFNADKTGSSGPTLAYNNPTSVTPQQGLVHISFQASDPDGLSFAYLIYGGDMAAEMLLEGTTADATFAVPYYTPGTSNGYTIFALDNQGNKTSAGVQFHVPGGYNQAPIPFIKLNPPVPGLNQPVTLDATQSSDMDNDPSSILAAWDVDNDGQFDTEPSTNKMVQYHYQNPGNYLVRLKLTDPAGNHTISTAVSINIPGVVCESILLSSQSEVDAFNCHEVIGNLTISGADIITLDNLSSLQNVSGSLVIADNPELLNVDGLSNLRTIGSGLSITNNHKLTDLNGFSNLQSIGSSFDYALQISGNATLSNLNGFPLLTKIDGNISITDNSALKTIDGFSSMTAHAGNLIINNNEALESVNGLTALTRMSSRSFASSVSLQFSVTNNKSLTHIDGFTSLTTLDGVLRNVALTISNNPALIHFDGLSSLSTIRASSGYSNRITITNNASLLRIPLCGLTDDANTVFVIENNPSLTGGPCTAAAVVSYDIVNTSGKILRRLNEGDILNLDDLKASGQTIVANTTGQIGSVKFFLGDNFFNIQNAFPYTLTGDNYGTYFQPWIPNPGTYTLTAIPYSESDGGGHAGQALTIHFTVKPESLLAVVSYDIVNTSGEVVRRLNEGDILYLHDLRTKKQTIVANTTGQTGSVKFYLNNKFFNIQNAFPYTLTGDNYGTYFQPWIPDAGSYTLTATPYTKSDCSGQVGQALTIHFTVKPESSTAVLSYDIVNTSGKVLRPLRDGDILHLNDLKANGQTIVANTTGQIGSVTFYLNNKFFNLQNAFPYTLTGDNYGTYFQPWMPNTGAYTITATPYSKSGAMGNSGQKLTITFTVVEGSKGAEYRIATSEEQSLEGSVVLGLTIYPVPVNNELFVKMDDNVGKDALISISTMQGISVYEGTYSNSSSINTVDFKPGVYVLRVASNNGFLKVVKFIKK